MTPPAARTAADTPLPLRALVLAAGRGERMRPLTDRTPKPLLPVHGRPLIEWHLRALARDGVREVAVNTAWLEEQFPAVLGDARALGLNELRYSAEGRDWGGALETAGGIATLLPWLTAGGREAFWLVSADIWAPGFRFDAALAQRFLATDLLAHVWMVPNPPFHPRGDFAWGEPLPALDAQACRAAPSGTVGAPTATYANLALVRAPLCAAIAPGTRAPLGPLLHQAAAQGRLGLQPWSGVWENVGTPAQWEALNRQAPPSPSLWP